MSLTKVTYAMINGPMVCVTDYGAVCDGVTDDYDAIMAAHDNAPDGSTILVKGACYYTQPLAFTRRLNWVCPGSGDYFKPNVGAGNDALTITGGTAAANLQHKINMYSASACTNALVLDLFWMSTIESRVAVNASAYAFKVIGALESRFYLKQSTNFSTPGGPSGLANNHLKIEANTTAPYGPFYTNANEFYVNFAGCINGVIHDSMSGQGDNTFRGTIQGLSGTPFYADTCNNLKLTELHFEGNPIGSAFVSCTNSTIENVINSASAIFALYSCIGIVVKDYVGGLNINAGCLHTKVINCRIDSDTYTDLSSTTEMIGGGVTSTSSSVSLQGGGGASPIENFFHNPFIDIWTNGASAAPDGFAAGSATFAQATTNLYGLGYGGKKVKITSTSTTLGNMATATPEGPFASTGDARWVSFMTAVYVATGQPNLVIYVFNGTSYESIGSIVSTKDSWVVVRGSVLITAAATPYLVFAPYSSAFVAGEYYVGGVSMVNGTSAPKFLIDSGRRLEYVVGSVSNTPAFVGQRAYVSGTGKWYMAKGTASNADWIILN